LRYQNFMYIATRGFIYSLRDGTKAWVLGLARACVAGILAFPGGWWAPRWRWRTRLSVSLQMG
jgi:hypothetical protein